MIMYYNKINIYHITINYNILIVHSFPAFLCVVREDFVSIFVLSEETPSACVYISGAANI